MRPCVPELSIRLTLPLLLGLLAGTVGCVRLSLKEPGEPMSQRDLRLRRHTREFATICSDGVQITADTIRAQTTNPVARTDAMRWKIGAGAAATEAALRAEPALALADAWAFSRQMLEFFQSGRGSNLFGSLHSLAANRSQQIESNIIAIARRDLNPGEFEKMESFVTNHARQFDIKDLSFEREPVAVHWKGFDHAPEKVTVGTTAEAAEDMGSRVTLLGQQIRQEAQWQLELAAGDLNETLQRAQKSAEQLDAVLQRVAVFAEAGPSAVTSAVAAATKELQAGFLPVLQRFETQWNSTLSALHAEREAVARDLSVERAAVVKAADEQRAALMKELDQTARAVTERGATQFRGLIRDISLFAVLGLLILLGLPFAFGFLAGRATSRWRREKTS